MRAVSAVVENLPRQSVGQDAPGKRARDSALAEHRLGNGEQEFEQPPVGMRIA